MSRNLVAIALFIMCSCSDSSGVNLDASEHEVGAEVDIGLDVGSDLGFGFDQGNALADATLEDVRADISDVYTCPDRMECRNSKVWEHRFNELSCDYFECVQYLAVCIRSSADPEAFVSENLGSLGKFACEDGPGSVCDYASGLNCVEEGDTCCYIQDFGAFKPEFYEDTCMSTVLDNLKGISCVDLD